MIGRGLLLNFKHQPFTIQTVYKVNKWSDKLHLVTLQLAYKMPFDISGETRLFFNKLLHTAFTETPLATVVGFQNLFIGMELGNGYNFNTSRNRSPQFPDIGFYVHSSAFELSPAAYLNTSIMAVSFTDAKV